MDEDVERTQHLPQPPMWPRRQLFERPVVFQLLADEPPDAFARRFLAEELVPLTDRVSARPLGVLDEDEPAATPRCRHRACRHDPDDEDGQAAGDLEDRDREQGECYRGVLSARAYVVTLRVGHLHTSRGATANGRYGVRGLTPAWDSAVWRLLREMETTHHGAPLRDYPVQRLARLTRRLGFRPEADAAHRALGRAVFAAQAALIALYDHRRFCAPIRALRLMLGRILNLHEALRDSLRRPPVGFGQEGVALLSQVLPEVYLGRSDDVEALGEVGDNDAKIRARRALLSPEYQNHVDRVADLVFSRLCPCRECGERRGQDAWRALNARWGPAKAVRAHLARQQRRGGSVRPGPVGGRVAPPRSGGPLAPCGPPSVRGAEPKHVSGCQDPRRRPRPCGIQSAAAEGDTSPSGKSPTGVRPWSETGLDLRRAPSLVDLSRLYRVDLGPQTGCSEDDSESASEDETETEDEVRDPVSPRRTPRRRTPRRRREPDDDGERSWTPPTLPGVLPRSTRADDDERPWVSTEHRPLDRLGYRQSRGRFHEQFLRVDEFPELGALRLPRLRHVHPEQRLALCRYLTGDVLWRGGRPSSLPSVVAGDRRRGPFCYHRPYGVRDDFAFVLHLLTNLQMRCFLARLLLVIVRLRERQFAGLLRQLVRELVGALHRELAAVRPGARSGPAAADADPGAAVGLSSSSRTVADQPVTESETETEAEAEAEAEAEPDPAVAAHRATFLVESRGPAVPTGRPVAPAVRAGECRISGGERGDGGECDESAGAATVTELRESAGRVRLSGRGADPRVVLDLVRRLEGLSFRDPALGSAESDVVARVATATRVATVAATTLSAAEVDLALSSEVDEIAAACRRRRAAANDLTRACAAVRVAEADLVEARRRDGSALGHRAGAECPSGQAARDPLPSQSAEADAPSFSWRVPRIDFDDDPEFGLRRVGAFRRDVAVLLEIAESVVYPEELDEPRARRDFLLHHFHVRRMYDRDELPRCGEEQLLVAFQLAQDRADRCHAADVLRAAGTLSDREFTSELSSVYDWTQDVWQWRRLPEVGAHRADGGQVDLRRYYVRAAEAARVREIANEAGLRVWSDRSDRAPEAPDAGAATGAATGAGGGTGVVGAGGLARADTAPVGTANPTQEDDAPQPSSASRVLDPDGTGAGLWTSGELCLADLFPEIPPPVRGRARLVGTAEAAAEAAASSVPPNRDGPKTLSRHQEQFASRSLTAVPAVKRLCRRTCATYKDALSRSGRDRRRRRASAKTTSCDRFTSGPV